MERILAGIEANYDIERTSSLTKRLWWVPLASITCYLLFISLGSAWMKNRKPFNLRGLLFFWNLSLALFSILGAVVTGYKLIQLWLTLGFEPILCDTVHLEIPIISLFTMAFVLSKVVEFGDTVFIVLRKTPLNFLHWYHHVSVCVFSWYSLAERNSPAQFYCTMNYIVHAVMYSYYIFKSSGLVRVPRFVAQSVTVLQLLQFGCGLAITSMATVKTYVYKEKCALDPIGAILGLSIYFSYVILFANFFYHRYLTKPVKKMD